jgi:predicted TPR repeat methyltransferase
VYGPEFAAVYDLLYGSKKDYAAEAASIRDLVLARVPDARSLLDVGCGTAEHLRHWSERFAVSGVEASAGMVAVARHKLPDVRIVHADMRTFSLDDRFDVVCSMYGVVGYLGNLDELHAAVTRMAAHTGSGGLVLFEPWIFQENWTGGIDVDDLTVRDGQRLARMGNWVTEGRSASIELHYLHGDGDSVRHFFDRQQLSLFTRDEYLSVAKDVLADVEFLPDSPSGRGMFVGFSLLR